MSAIIFTFRYSTPAYVLNSPLARKASGSIMLLKTGFSRENEAAHKS